jgi:hypothetical protein
MNNIELYVKGSSDTNYTRLDLFKDETISLTQTIQNVKDPAKVYTNFSKSFSLPASKTNNKFFKHYHNFLQSLDYSYDARKKTTAKIELNSYPFQKGKIRLEGVDLKNGRPDRYRITFFGELDLKEILGDLKLQDLDFLDEFDLTYKHANVKTALESTSGTGNVTGSDGETYITPTLVSLIGNSMRGFYDNSNTTPAYWDNTKQEINISGGNLAQNNSGQYSGYYWKDLVYSIRLYVIIKAIENSSITKDVNGNKLIIFSEDFFNTTNTGFYNLYMLCQRNAGKILEGLGSSYTPNNQNLKSYANATNNHTNNLHLDAKDFDIYNLTSSQQFQFTLTVTFGTITGNVYIDLRNKSNNTIVTTFTYTSTQSGGTRSFSIGNGTYELIFRADNEVQITNFSFNLVGLFGTYQTTSIATGDVDANFTIPAEGFSIKSNIPDITILDFLTGLFKMFNLTAYKEDGKIYVNTLDSYYNAGTLRDVTEYTDSTTKTVDKALPYREIDFKFEDTDNILAKNHKEQFQKDWGSANYNGDESLDSNNNVYEINLPFQHMKFEKLTTGLQVGHLLDDKQAAYLGKPVIYYPIHSSNTGESAPTINFIQEINGYDSGTTNTVAGVESYWIPSNTPAIISTGAGYPESIHFNLERNEWNDSSEYTDTLFEKYYKSYITNVFRYNERLTKIKARLPISFLQEYTLADELQIGNLTYRINSITSNLQTGESTLELLNGKETVVSSGQGSISIQISSSSSATPSTACGYTLNTTVYYSGTLGNTTRLYTDSGLTTAYTGSGSNHKFPNNNYATIDSNGYVSGYQPCPTLAPSMTTSTASNVTYTSFTLNGSLNVANGTVIERGFYWGVNASYASNTREVVSGTSTGSFSLSKSSGILANTTYYVTAFGENQHGEGVGTTESFVTNNQPVPPTVTAEAESNVGETSFTAELEITADGGATINGAGFYMGTDSSSATNNTHYDISPAPTSIGTKQYNFTGLTGGTTYYYWGTATNTFSSTKGVSSSYQQVTTNATPNWTTHSNIQYNPTDPYLACVSTAYNRTVYSSGTGNTFGAGLVIYDNNGLTNLAADGYYSLSNNVYQVQSGNGTLGTQTACTTNIYRLQLSAGYPTTYYTSTSAACSSSFGSVYAYYSGTLSNNSQMWTSTALTTKFTGAGTLPYPQYLTPNNYIVKAKRQYYNSTYNFWADLGSSVYVGFIDANGLWKLTYYDYNNGVLTCP